MTTLEPLSIYEDGDGELASRVHLRLATVWRYMTGGESRRELLRERVKGWVIASSDPEWLHPMDPGNIRLVDVVPSRDVVVHLSRHPGFLPERTG